MSYILYNIKLSWKFIFWFFEIDGTQRKKYVFDFKLQKWNGENV